MKTSNKIISTIETQIINKQVAYESIDTITEDKTNRYISVKVLYYDSENTLISNADYFINGDKYDLLMSASPDFAPNKPENEYREVDLWYVIDLLGDPQDSLKTEK